MLKFYCFRSSSVALILRSEVGCLSKKLLPQLKEEEQSFYIILANIILLFHVVFLSFSYRNGQTCHALGW